jgi:hypothetical protein
MRWATYLSVFVLIAANLIALAEYYRFDWDRTEVLLLFWSETMIVAFFTIVKMLLAKRETGIEQTDRTKFGRLFSILLFSIHFGGFMVGTLVLLILYFIPHFSLGLFGMIIIGIIPLFLSHGFSFVTNFIGKKEYEHIDANELMATPYFRLVPICLAVGIGAIGNASVLVLFIGKIAIDILGHILEHKD